MSAEAVRLFEVDVWNRGESEFKQPEGEPRFCHKEVVQVDLIDQEASFGQQLPELGLYAPLQIELLTEHGWTNANYALKTHSYSADAQVPQDVAETITPQTGVETWLVVGRPLHNQGELNELGDMAINDDSQRRLKSYTGPWLYAALSNTGSHKLFVRLQNDDPGDNVFEYPWEMKSFDSEIDLEAVAEHDWKLLESLDIVLHNTAVAEMGRRLTAAAAV